MLFRSILGDGSNILFTNYFDGIVISIKIKGMKIIDYDDDFVMIEVSAGENWHNFIKTCIKNKYYGLENLALIPGTVGAAPVQNIGAYGVEQSDCCYSVVGYDVEEKVLKTYNSEQCEFSYRNSIFKNKLSQRFIITSAIYKLSRKFQPILRYNELSQEVNKFCIQNPDAQYIYDTICRLRTKKLPNFEKLGNAGSFFKNPEINLSQLNEIKTKYENVPYFLINDNKYKIPAAWLIETCGLKGFRIGDAGVYESHSLVLVNYGSASGEQILNLAKLIIQKVFEEFGINLEPEVRIIS